MAVRISGFPNDFTDELPIGMAFMPPVFQTDRP